MEVAERPKETEIGDQSNQIQCENTILDPLLFERSYICPICDTSFNDFDEYIEDNRRHNGGKEFKCHDCGHVQTKRFRFKEHVRGHTGDRPFLCKVCGAGFKSSSALSVHRKIHSKQCVCEYCHQIFARKPQLRDHVDRIHLGKTLDYKFKCLVCDKAYPTPQKLREHSWSHSEDKPFKCGSCDKTFASSARLKDHLRVHTGEKPYICAICGWASKRANHLTLHMRTHSDERPFQCSYCGKGFKSTSYLNEHVRRTHTGERPYPCDICEQTFYSSQDRSFHKTSTHSDKKLLQLQCETCGKLFRKNYLLRDHVRIHSGEKPCVCNMCGKCFRCRALLRKHIRTHHNANLEDRKHCPHCNKEFATTYHLNRHLKQCSLKSRRCRVCQKCQNEDEASSCTYTCTVCLVELPCVSFMEHSLSHATEEPYQCSVCGKTKPDVLKFKKHLYNHTEPRQWDCAVCDRMFNKKASLTAHMARHREDCPNQCGVCQKTFPDKHRLKAHELVHTGMRPFKCDFCNKTFTHKGNLKAHIRVHDKEFEAANLFNAAIHLNTDDNFLGESSVSSIFSSEENLKTTDNETESAAENSETG